MTNREPRTGVDRWRAGWPPPKHTSGTPRPKDVFDDRGRSPGSRVGAVPSGLPSASSASGRWTASSPLTVAGAASASAQTASPNSLLAPEQSGEPRSASLYKPVVHRQASTKGGMRDGPRRRANVPRPPRAPGRTCSIRSRGSALPSQARDHGLSQPDRLRQNADQLNRASTEPQQADRLGRRPKQRQRACRRRPARTAAPCAGVC